MYILTSPIMVEKNNQTRSYTLKLTGPLLEFALHVAFNAELFYDDLNESHPVSKLLLVFQVPAGKKRTKKNFEIDFVL